MILTEDEVIERIESPLNLLNRLKSITNSHLPTNGNNKSRHPSLPPKTDDLIDDIDEKLAYGSIKSKAAGIMISAMNELKERIVEVNKPKELAAIAADMGKIVNAQERAKGDHNQIGQIVIYSPQMKMEDEYNVIDISRSE